MLQVFLVRFYALDALQALCILSLCALEKRIRGRRRVVFSRAELQETWRFERIRGHGHVAVKFCISGVVLYGGGVWVQEHIRFDCGMCSAVSRFRSKGCGVKPGNRSHSKLHMI